MPLLPCERHHWATQTVFTDDKPFKATADTLAKVAAIKAAKMPPNPHPPRARE